MYKAENNTDHNFIMIFDGIGYKKYKCLHCGIISDAWIEANGEETLLYHSRELNRNEIISAKGARYKQFEKQKLTCSEYLMRQILE